MVLVRRRGAGTRDIQTHVVVEAVKVSELASQQASQLLSMLVVGDGGLVDVGVVGAASA